MDDIDPLRRTSPRRGAGTIPDRFRAAGSALSSRLGCEGAIAAATTSATTGSPQQLHPDDDGAGVGGGFQGLRRNLLLRRPLLGFSFHEIGEAGGVVEEEGERAAAAAAAAPPSTAEAGRENNAAGSAPAKAEGVYDLETRSSGGDGGSSGSSRKRRRHGHPTSATPHQRRRRLVDSIRPDAVADGDDDGEDR